MSILAALSGILLPSSVALAAPVPLASFVESGGTNDHLPESISFDESFSDDSGNAWQVAWQVITTAGNKPSVDITADLNVQGTFLGPPVQVFGNTTYFFRFDGEVPDPDLPIPVRIFAAAEVSASGSGRAQAFARYWDDASHPTSPAFASASAGFPDTPASDGFDVVHQDVARLGVIGAVNYLGRGFFVDNADGEFQIVVDPVIEVDPSYPYADLITLTLSENIPEPSGVAFLGFCAGFVALRRRF